MQALIDFLVKNLLALWPISRIDEWERGLLTRNGTIVRELGGGRLHWRWPFVEQIRKWPTNIVVLDLGTASVTTCDAHSIAISGNLSYRMQSITQMHRVLWDADRTLAKLALGEVATFAASQRWTHLATERRAVEAELVAILNQHSVAWGVCVVAIRLTDLVPTRSHRHYVDGMQK